MKTNTQLQSQTQSQLQSQTDVNNNENKFTIMAMSVPLPYSHKTGFKSAIASIIYLDNFKIYKNDFIERMKFLNLSMIKIILIVDESNPLPENRIALYGIKNELQLIFVTYDEFFSISFIEEFLGKKKDNSYQYYFVFNQQNWHEICVRFASISIDISGGSNNKKHLLSPLNHKLSQFLICLFGGGFSSNEINKSFHKEMNELNKKNANISLLKTQEDIIDFAKSNEIFRNKILDESFVNSSEFEYIKHINSIKENEQKKESMNEGKLSHSKNNISNSRSYHTSACKYSMKEIQIKDPEVNYNEATKNNFLSDGNGIDELYYKFLNSIIDPLKGILEPVQVSYSSELLATQIYHISILLFIMSLLITVLLLFFILNVFIFVYSDKLMNYFNNKYLKWYIFINKKFIGIELILLGITILYFMYSLSYGIHFIATHPILFS